MATPRLASLTLRAADGGPLYVDVRTGARPGEARPAVVICHGFKGFKDWGFFPRVAERLALAGYTAVTFNFSGSGVGPASETVDEPERWFHQTLSADLADLDTVVAHVVSGAAQWVGLLGHSRGGALAILQAARDPRISALVTWGAVADFRRYSPADLERWRSEGQLRVVNSRTGQVLRIGTDALDDLEARGGSELDVMRGAERVTAPWLVVHGSADESVPVEDAARLAGAAAPGVVKELVIERAGHTFGARHPWAGTTPELDEVLRATVGHFAATLR